ncbi:MAG: response regulator transcription factor [Bacteroidetes bacterium]|nr:response regulator transcription factor [Bacteroidota bacterium]
MKILVVEDEASVREFIEKGLIEEGFEVTVVGDGAAGERLGMEPSFDAIILDWRLPEKSGLDVCKNLRTNGVLTPIIMLTAMNSVENRVVGLDSGADDYLTKPFAFEELIARIKALTRRLSPSAANESLNFAEISMDLKRKTVTRGEKILHLTAKEFSLLEYFMRNPERVLSRADIAQAVWNINFETNTNFIDVYVTYLRQKLQISDSAKQLIHTVRGMGYVLRAEEQPV